MEAKLYPEFTKIKSILIPATGSLYGPMKMDNRYQWRQLFSCVCVIHVLMWVFFMQTCVDSSSYEDAFHDMFVSTFSFVYLLMTWSLSKPEAQGVN